MFDKILRFQEDAKKIDRNSNSTKELKLWLVADTTDYINCEQGKSRSAEVKIALEKLYNNQEIFLPTYNLHVKETLLKIGKLCQSQK